MRNHLLLATGLLALPLLGAAQTTAAPRFYAGAGGAVFTAWPFHPGAPSLVGPGLTGGVQLAPRLALQVSPAVAWERQRFDYGGYQSNPVFFHTDNKLTAYNLPVLLRYTFTPAGPFHFDGLGGATAQFFHHNDTYTETQNGQVTRHSTDTSTSTYTTLTLGPAVRYDLTPALELTATPLVNCVVNLGYITTFKNRLTSNFLLGATYKFGQ